MFKHPNLYDERTKTYYPDALGRINTLELHRQEGILRIDVRWYSSEEAAGSMKDPKTIAPSAISSWSTVIPRAVLDQFLLGGLGRLGVDGLDGNEPPAKVFYELVRKFDRNGPEGTSRYEAENVGTDEVAVDPEEQAKEPKENV